VCGEAQAEARVASIGKWRSERFEPRVLVVTHSHPRLTKGGAEISAGALVKGMREDFGVSAWLLGASRTVQTDRLGVSISQPFGDGDFVYQAPDSFAWFNFANRDPRFPRALDEILTRMRPDIVHFHHYAQFGVEAFDIVKRSLPGARIVLTLHEYLAICNNYGQMVKKPSGYLCEQDSPIDCSTCFPELGPRDFFMRKLYISKFFGRVDVFISPSRFLRDRYVNWGLAPGKFAVIENVTSGPPPDLAPGVDSEGARDADTRSYGETGQRANRTLRIGFFGQMSPLKGIIVLLDAARILLESGVENISIEIHGSHSGQPTEFQKAVDAGLEKAESNVRYCGPYENWKVYRLMSAVDAVIVPSTWWENSPVVIEEALAMGKPVLCSNIGGMAEKVRNGVDGFHFETGDSQSLADLLGRIASAPERLSSVTRTARRPPAAESTVASHLDLYARLLS
jgi:glycosyltransferase involved in cell wall biosynthesis